MFETLSILDDLDVVFRELPEGEDPAESLPRPSPEPTRTPHVPRQERSVTWRGPSTLWDTSPDPSFDVVFL